MNWTEIYVWYWYCCSTAEISQEDTLSIILQFFSFVAVLYSSLKDVVLCFNPQAIIQEQKLPRNVVIIHWLSTLNYLHIQMHSVTFVVMNTNYRQCPRHLDWKQIGISYTLRIFIKWQKMNGIFMISNYIFRNFTLMQNNRTTENIAQFSSKF